MDTSAAWVTGAVVFFWLGLWRRLPFAFPAAFSCLVCTWCELAGTPPWVEGLVFVFTTVFLELLFRNRSDRERAEAEARNRDVPGPGSEGESPEAGGSSVENTGGKR